MVKTYQYQVVVGNIGTVYDGPNVIEARMAYSSYVKQSTENYGRAAGESVTMFLNGEVRREHDGAGEDEERPRPIVSARTGSVGGW